MQSPGVMRVVSPRKAPRKGQLDAVRQAVAQGKGLLPIQLPTGYGKTYVAAAVARALFETGQINRVLYLVSTTAQLTQFCNDGGEDFRDAGLEGVTPFDVAYSPGQALRRHRENTCAVFAATIQSVVAGSVGIAVREMLQSGLWMVVVDEYHHYGVDKTWGRAVLGLSCQFTLAMSATPERKNQDSAFGAPTVKVSYLSALQEEAVKQLVLHSYEYRVDAISINGEPISFTTTDVVDAAGSSDPGAIDDYIIKNKLRWSPKYISPLVSIPVERLLARRGGYPLQMIVGAMGCLHAKMVCEQIQSMFGEVLRVDWVGTGPNGRSNSDNEDVLCRFCPPKKAGVRRPEDVRLDVLVHVGMAGEGLDSVFVAEVVHLNPANITNANDQENGRAARRIPGAPKPLQTAFINVDSSSPYAEWSGKKIMQVFDRENGELPDDGDDESGSEPRSRNEDIPDEPFIIIADCRLENIDKGDPEVKGCADALVKAGPLDPTVLEDPNHPIWDAAIKLRHLELIERSKGQDGMSAMYQLRKSISDVVRTAASVAARMGSAGRFERSLVGDLCKRINSEMRKRFGHKIDDADEAELRERYRWVRRLVTTMHAEGLPPWLL